MRVYSIAGTGKLRYAGSMAEAKTRRAEMLEAGGFGPRSTAVEIKEIELPTSKAALLEFVNELAEKADPRESGDA